MLTESDKIDQLFDGTMEPEYFANKIQNILNRVHATPGKKKIVFYPNDSTPKRLNFACPYCGDSEVRDSKRRGNLFTNSLFYECYNCGKKSFFTNFCKDFNENIDSEDKVRIHSYIDHKSFTKSETHQIENLNKLLPLEEWINFMNNNPNSWLVNIKPITRGSEAYNYLIDRYIVNHENILQGTYQKFKEGKLVYWTNVIILLNRSGDKLLGIQLRNLEKDRNKRFFKIVDFEELYNYFHSNNPIDEIEAIAYNKLSHFYNILNVDFNSTITIFEGYLDSIFCYNSIGLVGANNDNDVLEFLINTDEHLKLRFFYDNDKTGFKNALKMMEKGYPVFLWKKLIEILINKAKDKNKVSRILNSEDLVDLNDLVKKFKDTTIYNKFNLDKYFSSDLFDKIYLPVVKFNNKNFNQKITTK